MDFTMERVFRGKRAVVTGGSRGIGLAIAGALVGCGAQALLVARNAEQLEAAAAPLRREAESRVHVCAADAAEGEGAAQAVMDAARRAMGGVDYLVNAAGGATITSALNASWATWRRDFDTKFWGYMAMMRAAIPVIRENVQGGVMLNIVGVGGKDPNPNLATASALNAALRAAEKVIADEVSSAKIRVVHINPGAVETGLLDEMAETYAKREGTTPDAVKNRMRAHNPLGRLPTPEDIAYSALFLLSDYASMVTATGLDIDGGLHRGLP